MVSAIDALVTRKDVIVYDAESHACILDGVRLHMGKRFVFPHNNIENLEKQLKRAKFLQKNLAVESGDQRRGFWYEWRPRETKGNCSS